MTTPTAAAFDARYSSPNATEIPWEQAEELLNDAAVYWITTISSENRAHVVPLLGVWDAGALHFTTGEGEQKRRTSHCTRTSCSQPARMAWPKGSM